MSTDLKDEIKKIKESLQSLKGKYGEQVEYVLLGSVYEDKIYQGGFEVMHVREQKTFYYYREVIKNASSRHRETLKFLDFARLGEFRVICKNDNIDEDKLEKLINSGGDWIVKGREYIVTKVTKNVDGLTFSIRELDGTPLIHSDSLDGYSSIRFDVSDYTKLN